MNYENCIFLPNNVEENFINKISDLHFWFENHLHFLKHGKVIKFKKRSNKVTLSKMQNLLEIWLLKFKARYNTNKVLAIFALSFIEVSISMLLVYRAV